MIRGDSPARWILSISLPVYVPVSLSLSVSRSLLLGFGGKTCFDQNASKKLCDKIKEIFAAFRFVVPFRFVVFVFCVFCLFVVIVVSVYIERREKITTTQTIQIRRTTKKREQPQSI